MKYFLLFIFCGISIILLIQIMNLKFSGLTEYGWGFFTGKIILLFIFITLSILTWLSIRKRSWSWKRSLVLTGLALLYEVEVSELIPIHHQGHLWWDSDIYWVFQKGPGKGLIWNPDPYSFLQLTVNSLISPSWSP